MNKLRLLLKLLVPFLLFGRKAHPKYGYKVLSRSDRLKLSEFHKVKVVNLMKNKGVQEFTIDGYTVLARDEQNALRKVKNLKRK